jgi:hypothetical protein
MLAVANKLDSQERRTLALPLRETEPNATGAYKQACFQEMDACSIWHIFGRYFPKDS